MVEQVRVTIKYMLMPHDNDDPLRPGLHFDNPLPTINKLITNTMSLSFEQMPSAIERIIESLERIENKLNHQINSGDSKAENGESLFTVHEAAKFLRLSAPTIYGLTHRLEIPHHKRGKRIYFLKSDLLEWVKKGKRMTNEEIEQQAEDLIRRKRRK